MNNSNSNHDNDQLQLPNYLILNILYYYFNTFKKEIIIKLFGKVSLVCKRWYQEILPNLQYIANPILISNYLIESTITKLHNKKYKNGLNFLYPLTSQYSVEYFNKNIDNDTSIIPYISQLTISDIFLKGIDKINFKSLKSLKILSINYSNLETLKIVLEDIGASLIDDIKISNYTGNTSFYFDQSILNSLIGWLYTSGVYSKIKVFDILANTPSPIDISYITKLENLTSLRLFFLKCTTQNMLFVIDKLKHLQSLLINSTFDQEKFDEVLENIGQQNRLDTLQIQNFSLTVSSIIRFLNSNSSVTSLRLYDIEFLKNNPQDYIGMTIVNTTIKSIPTRESLEFPFHIYSLWRCQSSIKSLVFSLAPENQYKTILEPILPYHCKNLSSLQFHIEHSQQTRDLISILKSNPPKLKKLSIHNQKLLRNSIATSELFDPIICSLKYSFNLESIQLSAGFDIQTLLDIIMLRHPSLNTIIIGYITRCNITRIHQSLLLNNRIENIGATSTNDSKYTDIITYLHELMKIMSIKNLKSICISPPISDVTLNPTSFIESEFKNTIKNNMDHLNSVYIGIYSLDQIIKEYLQS